MSQRLLGPIKGGQSVECQGQIFCHVECRLQNGSVKCQVEICVIKPSHFGIVDPLFFAVNKLSVGGRPVF